MLRGKTRKSTRLEKRVPLNIHPDAWRKLRDLLFEPDMQGVGYTEFIERAIDMANSEKGSGIADGNHALLCGEILGLLIQAKKKRQTLFGQTDIEIILEGDDYTNTIILKRESGTYALTLEKL